MCSPLIFWALFILVILGVSYPNSLTQANSFQIFAFFIPLILALTFSFNIFLKNIFVSFSISLGLIFLLILKALDSLNLVTLSLSIIAVGLLISYFRKANLTKVPKIPKLTNMRKHIRHPEERSKRRRI